MSTVTKCDVCGNTCKHEESKKLNIHPVNNIGSKEAPELRLDLCPTCHSKVLEVLGNAKQANT